MRIYYVLRKGHYKNQHNSGHFHLAVKFKLTFAPDWPGKHFLVLSNNIGCNSQYPLLLSVNKTEMLPNKTQTTSSSSHTPSVLHCSRIFTEYWIPTKEWKSVIILAPKQRNAEVSMNLNNFQMQMNATLVKTTIVGMPSSMQPPWAARHLFCCAPIAIRNIKRK